MHGLFVGPGNLEDLLLLSKLVRAEFVDHLLLLLEEVDAVDLEFELFVVLADLIPEVEVQEQMLQRHLRKQVAEEAALELRVG